MSYKSLVTPIDNLKKSVVSLLNLYLLQLKTEISNSYMYMIN